MEEMGEAGGRSAGGQHSLPALSSWEHIYEDILDDAFYEKLQTHLFYSMDLFLTFIVSANACYVVLLLYAWLSLIVK